MKRFFPLVVISALTVMLPSVADAGETGDQAVLKQYLTQYVTSNQLGHYLPPTHPLYPLSRIPIAATTTFIAFSDEPGKLEELYPYISKSVYSLFSTERVDGKGLITGSVSKREGASLSPVINALANLEIYSLHKIASSIGEYEDAIDILLWSEKYASILSNTFFAPDPGYIFPRGEDGEPLERYFLENLLILLLDNSLGETQRERICARLKVKLMDAKDAENSRKFVLFEDVSMEIPIVKLLESIPEYRNILGVSLRGLVLPTNAPDNTPWMEFWMKSHPRKTLFDPRSRLSICFNLSNMLDKYDLLAERRRNPFRERLAYLTSMLEKDELSTEEFTSAVSKANSLLVDLARFNTILNKPEDLWREFNGSRFDRLSPRTKRILREAFPASIDEVKSYKRIISRKYSRSAGIAASLELPRGSVPIGEKIPFKAMLKSISDTLYLSYAYLQIGDRRWKLTREGPVTITPNGPPIILSSRLTPEPSVEPGILSLPVFFDLNSNASRLEIHKLESIYLAKPSQVSLEFPEGKRLSDETPLPLDIVIRYQAKHDIQGKVDGVFFKEISTEPPLPSRFLIKSGRSVISLPLKIRCGKPVPPGRYPFSIIVSIGDHKVGYFSEELVKPLRWLELGPLSREDIERRSPLSYQNELLRKHRLVSGKVVKWKEVPRNALDETGRFRPDIVYGKSKYPCFLLYTVFSMPYEREAVWQVDTQADVTLWLNSEPVSPDQGIPPARKGTMKLRKGINTILLSVCCSDSWKNVGFRIGDENLLPLFGMNNEIENLIDGFETITTKDEGVSPGSERMKKVIFALDYPEARNVSVIGTFNNWDPEANPMKRDNDGRWKAVLYLAPGKYSYKFIINGKTKITDPSSKQVEPDGFGGLNSILTVR